MRAFKTIKIKFTQNKVLFDKHVIKEFRFYSSLKCMHTFNKKCKCFSCKLVSYRIHKSQKIK